MKKLLFIFPLLLCLNVAQADVREVGYKLTFGYPIEILPKMTEGKVYPWKLKTFKIQNIQIDLNSNCRQIGNDTLCEGKLSEVEFMNYRGLSVFAQSNGSGFHGAGIMSMELFVEGEAFLKTPFKDHARSGDDFYIERNFRSDRPEQFPLEQGHRIFDYTDGPFIGNTIRHNRDRSGYLYMEIEGRLNKDSTLRLVCTEVAFENCVAFQIVAVIGGKRDLLNSTVFKVENAESIKAASEKRKKEIQFQGSVMLPASSSVSDMCVPVLLPITLPLDILILPVTFPIALAKRTHARNLLESFFNLTESEVKTVGTENFIMLVQALGGMRLQ